MKVNLAGVVSKDFPIIPSGIYDAIITEGELRTSGDGAKHPGAQYINWEFTLQDPQFQGQKQWQNTSLLPDALFSLKDILGATGKYDVEGELDFEIEDVIGTPCKIKVRVKKYKGEDQNEVKKVYPADYDAGSTGGSGSLLP